MRLGAFLFAFAAACGGSTFAAVDTAKDASTSDAAGDGAADARADAADASTDVPVLDGDACASLLANVDRLRPTARTCCPSCNALQCTETVDDVCCPISVTHADAQDVVAFADAVRAFRAQCAPMCPGRPCAPTPTNDCDPNTSLCK